MSSTQQADTNSPTQHISKNESNLDTEKHRVSWLTCTEVSADDYLWERETKRDGRDYDFNVEEEAEEGAENSAEDAEDVGEGADLD